MKTISSRMVEHTVNTQRAFKRDGAKIEWRDPVAGCMVVADLGLLLIRKAWGRGCDFEEEADGYGAGMGTMDDWSGIRDSSDEAKEVMLEKALVFFGFIR